MYLKDPKSQQPSVTLTAFVAGFLIACLKLLLSGVTIKEVALSQFSGTDFAAVVGALGAVYWARRKDDSKEEDK